MTLILHSHPLSSFCQKVLMALYETGTLFDIQPVNLQDDAERASYLALSPFGKIPALEDTTRNQTIFETTIIIEYLQQHYPGHIRLIPDDPDTALEVRLWDRLFDTYIHQPMQRIVGDSMRAESKRDPQTVFDARRSMRTAYDLVEQRLVEQPYPGGSTFTLADCAAAPALFYAQAAEPFAETHPRIAGYFNGLTQRPSFKRLIGDARPFLKYFPLVASLPSRFQP